MCTNGFVERKVFDMLMIIQISSTAILKTCLTYEVITLVRQIIFTYKSHPA